MSASRRFLRSKIVALVAWGATAAVPASVAVAADLAETTLSPEAAAVLTVPAPIEAEVDPAELECMAKVVMHEAGNQPYDGKVAVAQTLVNRLAAKRFGGSICEVANQRGQYFNTAAFDPDKASDGWLAAAQVARAVLSGSEDPVAPGAMFFRSAASSSSGFFRSRQRIASVGAHVFYR